MEKKKQFLNFVDEEEEHHVSFDDKISKSENQIDKSRSPLPKNIFRSKSYQGRKRGILKNTIRTETANKPANLTAATQSPNGSQPHVTFAIKSSGSRQ